MDVFFLALLFGQILDFFGIVVIVLGVCIASSIFLKDFLSFHKKEQDIYKIYRTNIGRSILIGLEIIVGGDIIRSVVGQPDFTTVGLLVLIILIRTFLSVTFDMELEGKWPWKRK